MAGRRQRLPHPPVSCDSLVCKLPESNSKTLRLSWKPRGSPSAQLGTQPSPSARWRIQGAIMLKTSAFLLLFALTAAVAQVNTSTMDGLVTDPQAALIARAEVTVTNTLTGQVFRTVTDDKGHWA